MPGQVRGTRAQADHGAFALAALHRLEEQRHSRLAGGQARGLQRVAHGHRAQQEAHAVAAGAGAEAGADRPRPGTLRSSAWLAARSGTLTSHAGGDRGQPGLTAGRGETDVEVAKSNVHHQDGRALRIDARPGAWVQLWIGDAAASATKQHQQQQGLSEGGK